MHDQLSDQPVGQAPPGSWLLGASGVLTVAPACGPVIVCLCPCSFAGHDCTCTVRVGPGERYVRAWKDGLHGPYFQPVCVPCWEATLARPWGGRVGSADGQP